jgi:peptidyl-prolyl cis-trans isomerase SurA
MSLRHGLAFGLAVVFIAAARGQVEYGDSLLAVVGDKVITAFEIMEMTQPEEGQLRRSCSGGELTERLVALRRKALNSVIERELIYLEFQKLQAKVPTSFLQDRLNQVVTNAAGGNLAQFEEQLHAQGMTITEFRERLHKDIAIELLTRDRLTRGNIVTDHDVDRHYEAQKASLATPARYRLGIIQLLKTGRHAGRVEEVCRDIQAQLAAGTPFAELAKKYSEGPGADQGGDQGWFSDMNQKLAEAVKAMAAGQTTKAPIEIGTSWYFVHLLAVDAGGTPPLDDELREQLRRQLEKQEEDRRYAEFIRELYMKYPVRRMEGL